MCIDLHTHSVYSDGSATPAELIALAAHNRLRGVALTDHDTVEGVAEFLQLGEQAGLTVLSGVEVSCSLRQHTLPLLGAPPVPRRRNVPRRARDRASTPA